MSWPIQIGVSKSGELLIGARAVQTAEHRGELADSQRIWPSQLEHRCACHWVRALFEDKGAFAEEQKNELDKSDRWTIETPRRVRLHRYNCYADVVKNFPKADRAKSTRKQKEGEHGKQK